LPKSDADVARNEAEKAAWGRRNLTPPIHFASAKSEKQDPAAQGLPNIVISIASKRLCGSLPDWLRNGD